MSGSTIRILQKRKAVQKKAMGLVDGIDTERWSPAPDDHPAVRLFERINAVDTWPDFVSQWEIQENLTGNVLVWTPRNRFGRPAEMWVLPTALMQYMPMSPAYPYGAWRFMPYFGMAVPMGLGVTSGAIIPGDEVLHYRCPHPLARWDGLSPLTAMAKEIDSYDSITDSRESSFAKGVRPTLLVRLKNGSTVAESQRVADALTNSHGGTQNDGKIIVYEGDDMDVDNPGTTPREMDFQGSWEQAVKASLAGFGVPSAIAGLTEAPAYAAYFASLKQFFSNKLAPSARSKAEFLTKHLIAPNYGRGYRCQIDLPTIDDQDIADRQVAADAQSGLRTFNELRGARSLPPMPGGDVPVPIYMAKMQQAIAPPPPPPMPMDSPDGPPRGEGQDGPTPPRNDAGEGSLPPRMKAVGQGTIAPATDRVSAAKRYAAEALAKLGE